MAVFTALTLLCLGFLAGIFLVLSFLEKPILPIMTAPHEMREHESDVRWTLSQLQSLVSFFGTNSLLPVILVAAAAATYQMFVLNFHVVAVVVALGASALCLLTFLQTAPAMRAVRDTAAYEADLDSVSSVLFRMVRLHHGTFMVVIPLTLAQLLLLII